MRKDKPTTVQMIRRILAHWPDDAIVRQALRNVEAGIPITETEAVEIVEAYETLQEP